MNKRQMQCVLNTSKDAFMIVNQFGIIELANEMIEEIFGVCQKDNYISYDSNMIEKDDIVIFVTSKFGIIDEELNVDDLSLIGIKNVHIKRGSSIIAIGCYKNDEIEPILKILNQSNDNVLEIDTYFMGHSIYIKLDIEDNALKIKIGTNLFESSNCEQLNKMVIIGGMDNKVKYYSGKIDNNENLKSILHGDRYKEKKDFYYVPFITNRYILEAIPKNSIIEKINIAINDANFTSEEGNALVNNYLIHYCIYKIQDNINNDCKIVLKMSKIITCYSDVLAWMDQVEDTKINLKTSNNNDYIYKFSEILGTSSEIMNVKYIANRASQSTSTVIIYGESGTGKSLLARMIHKNSKISSMPFIEVNCASVPESLAESEFFGYEKGAFTGAVVNGKKGFFELAQNGTIFLDEIGELTLPMQAKLLEVIQNRCFYKVGGTKKIGISTRIIAATNKDLQQLIKEGKFREDLYYRINVLPIIIPPLRKRRFDIKELANKLLWDISKRLDVDIKILSPSSMSKILEHNWPGNIRELENILEAAVNISESNIICPSDLLISSDIKENNKSLKERLEELEKKIIEEKMIEFNGDKIRVMEHLEIGRSNLFNKLNKYNIKSP